MLISPHPELCLSYANTLSWRGNEVPAEALPDFAALLRWLGASAGTSPAGLRRAASWARAHPGKAARVFAEAIELREALYRLFSAIAAGKRTRQLDFTLLQQALAAAPTRRLLAASGGAHGWRIGSLRPTAPDLLAPVLWSAGDALVSDVRHRVRRCANQQCLWLFVDASKGGTRRWCAMASCGNRAKAHRHYVRTRRTRG